MAEKPVKGDKVWRSAALVVLCALVYYFSYDHGRQSVQPQLEAVEKQAITELEAQRREIVRLQTALAECGRSATAGETPSVDRIPLRVNQSRILSAGGWWSLS